MRNGPISQMSHNIRKCIYGHVRPAKIQISLCIQGQTRVFVVRMKKICILGYPKCAQWNVWSECENAGWSESSLGAHIRSILFGIAAQMITANDPSQLKTCLRRYVDICDQIILHFPVILTRPLQHCTTQNVGKCLSLGKRKLNIGKTKTERTLNGLPDRTGFIFTLKLCSMTSFSHDNPAGTQYQNDVVSISKWRRWYNVILTLYAHWKGLSITPRKWVLKSAYMYHVTELLDGMWNEQLRR